MSYVRTEALLVLLEISDQVVVKPKQKILKELTDQLYTMVSVGLERKKTTMKGIPSSLTDPQERKRVLE